MIKKNGDNQLPALISPVKKIYYIKTIKLQVQYSLTALCLNNTNLSSTWCGSSMQSLRMCNYNNYVFSVKMCCTLILKIFVGTVCTNINNICSAST